MSNSLDNRQGASAWVHPAYVFCARCCKRCAGYVFGDLADRLTSFFEPELRLGGFKLIWLGSHWHRLIDPQNVK